MTNYTTISIPKPLAEKVKKKIEGTSFNNISNYTAYILRMILMSSEIRENSKAFTMEDEFELKKRLRAMGYI